MSATTHELGDFLVVVGEAATRLGRALLDTPARAGSAPEGDAQVLTLTAAAKMIGISYNTAWKLASRGEFPVPAVKIGRKTFVSRRRLERYLAGQDEAP